MGEGNKNDIGLRQLGHDAFPAHVFDVFGTEPRVFADRIGGSVMVVEKHPPNGPITVMTSGVSRIPVDSGEPVEFAVEVVDGQQGAAFVALQMACDRLAHERRAPTVGTTWRASGLILGGTEISAMVATGSRWGSQFDDVRHEGQVVGHVLTLRLLTDAEAAVVEKESWAALVERVGVDALLDVERGRTGERRSAGGPGAGTERDIGKIPVVLSKLHEQHPPRWVTFMGGRIASVTGYESDEYMQDPTKHEVWIGAQYVQRFPWVERFLREGRDGQTALFTDASGDYTLEDD